MRETDEAKHELAIEREQKAIERKQAAQKRFIASIILALVGMYKLTIGGAEGTSELLWVGAIVLAGGLASVEQILTAMGKRS